MVDSAEKGRRRREKVSSESDQSRTGLLFFIKHQPSTVFRNDNRDRKVDPKRDR